MGLLGPFGEDASCIRDRSSSLSTRSGSSIVDPPGDEGGADDVAAVIAAIVDTFEAMSLHERRTLSLNDPRLRSMEE